MFYYRVYGLNIKSAQDISFLKSNEDARDVDLSIELVGNIKFPEQNRINLGLAIDVDNNLLLDVPKIAKYMITNDKILVAKAVGSDPESVNNFLISSAIPYYLVRQGKIILRGCAYTKDGKSANLIMGISGVGKSTLLAAFCKKDYKMLTDQFCVLTHKDNKIYVESAFPKIKLWLQATRILKIDTDNLPKVRPNLKRYYWQAPFCSDRLEVRNVFIINEQNLEKENASEEVIGVKKITALDHYIHSGEFDFLGKNHKIAITKAKLKLASQANFFKVLNIRGKSTIDGLCKLIEDKSNEQK
ncbi:serine/threonine protein kinase [Francisella philomiragia]|uniref:HPr kinase/phosphorylase C-terminal domain-containing protein n=1 Tax=Francisella philomiragia TaxID=28110 RepID=A0AAW3DBU4_9GAMM|nr:hypothetical protein [Francisella philomiragia]KFJ42647.1 hypothetical protein DR78_422 [Francisella philomiragia]MBK2255678.1 serine/threonine protein kinase [Francisella philomiragia]MBK2273983.1 serine/threonine protein kinase [Francisella philomiragia]MBK2277824.1 serine/threonine protein kinase [Francisella philomiragia]MBK2281770.1 serine/threonine protein kinase [Francisella philomiragia]